MKPFRRQRVGYESAKGFSLLEIMIALVLGFIVIGGTISVYLASKQSLTEVEQVAGISENGRFALQLLGYSVRHVGFFGGASPADIREDASLGAVGDNCTGDLAAYNTDNPIFAVRATSALVATCIDDARPETDVLVIKGVGPSPLYDADPGDSTAARDGVIDFPPGEWSEQLTYVISNNEAGILVDGADTHPDVQVGNEFALGVAWPYRVQIFYIRDHNGDGSRLTLSRKFLAWDTTAAAMSLQTQDLVEGVENMRFLFGYDSLNDGEVDTLGNLTEVDAADAWNQVTSLQVFLLLRSDAADPGYTNAKTYQLGDIPIEATDSVRRILMHADIALRNPRLVLRGS